jgi:endonuclease YncB( thermonuclease family)
MIKRLAGSALIAASLSMVLQPEQMKTSDLQVKQEKVAETAAVPSGQIPVTLVETIDGDTIKVKVNGKVENVRYLLIDTPESKNPGMCVQPYANEAAERNNELVRKGRLTIELETGVKRDTYGRLLAYVYVDGQSVQETLVKEGFARIAYIMNPPYKYLSVYENGETFAKRNKVKIWSMPNYVTKRGFNGCVEGSNLNFSLPKLF